MVDSGGQYLDGTTDVTRTFHYGSPTEEMIERYTDVLQVPFPPVSVTYIGGRITNVNLNYTLKIDRTNCILGKTSQKNARFLSGIAQMS